MKKTQKTQSIERDEQYDSLWRKLTSEVQHDEAFGSPFVAVIVNDELDYCVKHSANEAYPSYPYICDALEKLETLLHEWQIEFRGKLELWHKLVLEPDPLLDELKYFDGVL